MKLRFKFLAVLLPFAAVFSACASDTFRTLNANGMTYTNVTVTAVTATDIYFTCDGGMGNAKLKNLSADLQQHFHYDAAKAAGQEKQQALANAQYFASQPPDWQTDFNEALNLANSQNKCILIVFVGSYRGHQCVDLGQQVFSSSQFDAFAQRKLVLVKMDDLHRRLNEARWRHEFGGRFNVTQYPTCILLDSSGKELGRQVGYGEDGPAAFVARFNSFIPVTVTARAPAVPADPVQAIAVPKPIGQPDEAPKTATVGQLDTAPKFIPNWYLIAGIPSAVLLLLLMFRSKAST